MSNSTRRPAPFVVPSSLRWDGMDGPWSTFTVQVGHPPQEIHLLPSTSLAMTLVPGVGACPEVLMANSSDRYNLPYVNPHTCSSSRGNIYYRARDNDADNALGGPKNQSTAMPLNDYLTFSNVGAKMEATGSLSNMSFGYAPSSPSGPGIKIPLSEFNEWNYTWTGLLSLDRRPANYTTGDEKDVTKSKITTLHKSLVQTMKDTDIIPNLSWGYTAGSYNRGRTFGSLVLGGVDTTRIIPNRVKFPFYSDDEIPFILNLNRITLRGLAIDLAGSFVDIDVAAQMKDLSTSPSSLANLTATNIDSNQPFLYLPQPVCDTISKAFGLNYDQGTNRYIIPESTHKVLDRNDASMTLSLYPRTNEKEYVNITITYNSLNQYNGFPYGYPNLVGARYFPIRPTKSMPVLGRTFLQDAYLYADYDTQTFHVSQVDWESTLANKAPHIQEHYPYPQPPSHLSRVAIAGIAAGISTLALIIAIVWYMCRRSKIKNRANSEGGKNTSTSSTALGSSVDNDQASPDSMDDETKLVEADTNVVLEADSNPLSPPPVEMDGKQFSELPDATGTLGGYFREVELDGNEKKVYEMEGSLVDIDLLKVSASRSSPSSSAVSEVRTATTSPASVPSLTPGTAISAESTLDSGVSSISSSENTRDTIGPLPRFVPTESRSSKAVRDRLNGLDVPPASPIPQTPLEFYGGVIPEARWREAQIRAVEQRLLRDRIRPIASVGEIVEADDDDSAAPPAYEEKDSILFGDGDVKAPLNQADEANTGKTQERPVISKLLIPKVGEAGPSTPTPASPIPRTPLRFYGRQPEVHRDTDLGDVEEETRSAQSFNVPTMTFTLPSPETEGSSAQTKAKGPVEDKSWSSENGKGKGPS